jgi:hypothetical protein
MIFEVVPAGSFLGGDFSCRARLRIEEADESLDVLSCSSKEELFANKPDTAQPQATESNLILQFTKQRLNFSALAQCMFESRSVCTIAGPLPSRFVYMDAETAMISRSAL